MSIDKYLAKHNQVIILKFIIFILYAGNNAISKFLLTSSYISSTVTIVFLQHAIAASILTPCLLYCKQSIPRPIRSDYHIYRVALSIIGIILLNETFRHMSIAEAVGINLLGPIITLFLAYYGLNERITYEKIGLIILAIVAQLSFIGHTISQAYSNVPWYAIISPTLVVFCFQLHTYFTKRLSVLGEHPVHLTWGVFFAIPIALAPWIELGSLVLDYKTTTLLVIMAVNALLAISALNHAIKLSDINVFIPLGLCKYMVVYTFDVVFFQKPPTLLHSFAMLLGCVCIFLLQNSLQRQASLSHNPGLTRPETT